MDRARLCQLCPQKETVGSEPVEHSNGAADVFMVGKWRALALIPAAVAVLSMAGWVFRLEVLAPIGLRSMQFNAALGVLLVAVALLVRGRLPGIALGSAAALLGLLTLVQYPTGLVLGIDTLFWTPRVPPPSGFLGRMAWQTAVLLVVGGAGCIGWHRGGATGVGLAGVSGSMLVAVALWTLVGRALVPVDLIRAFARTTPSPPLVLSLLSIGVWLIVAARGRQPARSRAAWVPLAVLVATATTGGLLWHWVRTAELRSLAGTLEREARDTAHAARTEVDVVRVALQRMADRWRASGAPSEELWRVDAGNLVRDLKLVGVWQVDAGGVARRRAPEGWEPGARLGLGAIGRECTTSPHGTARWRTVMSAEAVPLVVAFGPVHVAGDSSCLVAMLPWHDIVARALQVDPPVALEVSVPGGAPVALGGVPVADATWASTLLDDQRLTLSVAPTVAFLAAQRTWSAELVLMALLVFGVLGSLGLRQAQLSAEHQRALAAASEAARAAEHQAAIVLENSGHGFWDWDVRSGQATLDPTWHRLLGYDVGAIPATFAFWQTTIHPDDRAAVLGVLERHLESDDSPYDIDYRALRRDGTWTWVNARGRVHSRDTDGRPLRMMGTMVDVSERKRAEQATLTALVEKETLLREIHHRVKNNLAVISSLFYYHRVETADPLVARVFQDGQDRTRSMAMVHELLYRAGDLSRIDFGDYIRQLATHLSQTHGVAQAPIVDAAPVRLSLDAAVPCGLIVNELITNAFKHAYPNRRFGQVTIRLRESAGRVLVAVADDGVGWPADVDPLASPSLGLRLVRSLTEQLGGSIAFHPTHPGTEVRLSFTDAVWCRHDRRSAPHVA